MYDSVIYISFNISSQDTHVLIYLTFSIVTQCHAYT